ncbi:hypothetical protein HRbin17_02792 [bacterium HR17]|uniref:Uncharacterized protein n=1 Tax=Candidatus Fervidibacter japonicus TaxID=2035412 RepID=A0A2H5XGE0_9BACT|nr:hypothetical protein HRbin17_02792 [bacterium HR17]
MQRFAGEEFAVGKHGNRDLRFVGQRRGVRRRDGQAEKGARGRKRKVRNARHNGHKARFTKRQRGETTVRVHKSGSGVNGTRLCRKHQQSNTPTHH